MTASREARRLSPGQRPAPLQRFGLPEFAAVRPVVPDRPMVTVTGRVRHPTQIAVADLLACSARRDHTSDLHCVTGWSALDLTWSGAGFAEVHHHLAARVLPRPDTRWVTVAGLDGYRSVRSVCAIVHRIRYDSGSTRWRAHPRGRDDHRGGAQRAAARAPVASDLAPRDQPGARRLP